MNESQIEVTVKLSGWLANYFPEAEMRLFTHRVLEKALPDLVESVMAQAFARLPEGGFLITVNGQNVNAIDQKRHLLQETDVVMLIPVVAGG